MWYERPGKDTDVVLSSKVTIVDAASMKEVASYTPISGAAGLSGAGIMNDKIYVSDHGENNDQVYVSSALNIPKPVATTAAPATTKAAAAATTKAASAASAKTADMGVVIAAIALTAGAALVVCKKRK